MRLLNTITGRLHYFDHNSPSLPRYATLSHVWNKKNGEQSFQDLCRFEREPIAPAAGATANPDDPSHTLDPRLSPKIRNACICARNLKFDWIWIDSCCIDQTSSAELSEAITSMFAWYAGSEMCIAYLHDVSIHRVADKFDKSVWFLRGWTLQELIAPPDVLFVSQEWQWINTRKNLAQRVERITQVDSRVLTKKKNLDEVPIGQRLAWASERRTTRAEDRSYSLMGILGILIAIMYGEGEAAFIRLQEEILRRYPDQSLFCWSLHTTSTEGYGLLAPRLEAFLRELNGPRVLSVVNIPWEEIPAAAEAMMSAMQGRKPNKFWRRRAPLRGRTPEFTITPFGIRARVPLIRRKGDENRMHACAVIVLGVRHLTDNIGITLHRISVAIDGPPHYAVGYPPGVDADNAVGGQMSRRLFVTSEAATESRVIQAAAGRLGLDKNLVLNWEEIHVVATQQSFTPCIEGRLASHSLDTSRTGIELVVPPWIVSGMTCPKLRLTVNGAELHGTKGRDEFPWITIAPPVDDQHNETEVQLSFKNDAGDEEPLVAGSNLKRVVVWMTTVWSSNRPERTVDRISLGVTMNRPMAVQPQSVVVVEPPTPVPAIVSCRNKKLSVRVEYLHVEVRDTLRVFIERVRGDEDSDEDGDGCTS